MTAEGVSVSTVVFDHLPVIAAIHALAELGIRQVEPALIRGFSRFDEAELTPHLGRALRRAGEAAGVTFPTISLHCDLGAPDGIAALARRVVVAAEAGAARIVTNAGRKGDIGQVRRTIETLLPTIEAAGLILAIENPGHGTGAITGLPEDHAAIVRSFDSSAVQANIDLCNVHSYSRGSAEVGDLAPLFADAGSLHLKDIRTSGRDWHFCALGEGEMAIPGPEILRKGLPVVLELPLGLWRPNKGDPQRLTVQPDPDARRSAILCSLAAIGWRV